MKLKFFLLIVLAATTNSFGLFARGNASDIDTTNIVPSSTVSPEIKDISLITNLSDILPFQDRYQVWDTINPFPYHVDLRNMPDTVNIVLNDDEDCKFSAPSEGWVISGFGYRTAPRFRYVVSGARRKGKNGRYSVRRVRSHFLGFGSHIHAGVDIVIHTGDSIYAAWDGVVRISNYNVGGYGNCVIIRHYNGLETLYGHLSARNVRPGQFIKAGELIGLGGSTGHSTGPHLHFETRFLGQAIDPNKIIDFGQSNDEEGFKLKSETIALCKYTFGAPLPYNNFYRMNRYGNQYAKSNVRNKVYAYSGNVHKVSKGDNISKIAKRYGTSVNKLCQLNGISRDGVLALGQKIKVK
jgi:murein DD-endopeptidase MepM/ murein hydrolase activator NlpD